MGSIIFKKNSKSSLEDLIHESLVHIGDWYMMTLIIPRGGDKHYRY